MRLVGARQQADLATHQSLHPAGLPHAIPLLP